MGPDKWTNIPRTQPGLTPKSYDTSSQYWMSPDLKKSIVAGDYEALKTARNKHQDLLRSNLTSIKDDKGKHAGFNRVTDEATGKDYWLCASDSGWLGLSTQPSSSATTCPA